MSATIGTRLYTLLHGQYVGRDEFGNRYFQQRKPAKNRRRKRWVMYQGMAEPTKVPPSWHGWLHHTVEQPPIDGQNVKKYKWQKSHLPNLTGTDGRYLPAGHVMRGAERAPATADYVAWKPE